MEDQSGVLRVGPETELLAITKDLLCTFKLMNLIFWPPINSFSALHLLNCYSFINQHLYESLNYWVGRKELKVTHSQLFCLPLYKMFDILIR